ncbi:Branched-chain amino acid transport ATP-binding protein LivG (TC 3.A.1.4.1) [Olavius algarvensis spirochete endosymbiont]|uniref:ABC transporter ATP-binding protein n=1 Tax=Olavius algarvensis spirochete endosymbiont TaxID=260710 RepID=UPI000F1E4867|nr:ABC transporter ATP-binding protein [Olavius algarvensis spirochete endosymbiont]VDB00963.1 Branched-chain amino acid transport ATP-binding protein LivG (TC 3.A.1.4.1) [Olavius algarvensis spirochete endosymbiont]
MSDTILDIRNFSMIFGGLHAVNCVNIHIDKCEIVALIGPNGAGKTTLFNCITGLYTPTEGDITVYNSNKKTVRINGLNPNKITELGLARTFQNIRLFNSMTALENVMIGCHTRLKAGILGAILRDGKTRAEEQGVIDTSMGILKKLKLERYANETASNLPYGPQRLLEIARAMATEPQLLLLDEPAAGMNLAETKRLDYIISKIRDEEQITILLIEHDMNLVMSIAERIYVLDYGELIAEGTPAEIKANPAVIKAYLGE